MHLDVLDLAAIVVWVSVFVLILRFIVHLLCHSGSEKEEPKQSIKTRAPSPQIPKSNGQSDELLNRVLEGTYQTLKSATLRQEIKLAVLKYGVRIYGWERVCYKCRKTTKVYSYYLFHDLKRYISELEPYEGEDGLGYIPSLDRLVAESFPEAAIWQRYSRSEGESYFANGCLHCDSLQGRYYVVDDPHEICEDLWAEDDNMEQYLVSVLSVPEPIADEIADYIVASVYA